jgi:hypothetical protein
MSAEGEARPTRIFIAAGDEDASSYELADEQAELDFVTGRFPISYRAVLENEDVSAIPEWQLKFRKLKAGETAPEAHLRVVEKQRYCVVQVPDAYEGIREGDTVAMVLGGSGDYLVSAAARVAVAKGGAVVRIAPFNLQKEREAAGYEDKDRDAELLASLATSKPRLFYGVAERDQGLILVRERYKLRMDAMKARIACEQRLRQRVIGNIFTSPDGLFPEGGVEKAFADLKATDMIYQALEKEETRAERELTKALESLDVYQLVFKPIEGMGPMIAARIISAVIDIRRFSTPAKFTAFAGVHVLKGGQFARRRNSQVANWHGDLRQALYLSSDQWNRRPDSVWGKYFRQMKAGFRARHPEPVVVEKQGGGSVKRYTDGHIHKMAQWRTMTRFAEYLFSQWRKLDRAEKSVPEIDAGDDKIAA